MPYHIIVWQLQNYGTTCLRNILPTTVLGVHLSIMDKHGSVDHLEALKESLFPLFQLLIDTNDPWYGILITWALQISLLYTSFSSIVVEALYTKNAPECLWSIQITQVTHSQFTEIYKGSNSKQDSFYRCPNEGVMSGDINDSNK